MLEARELRLNNYIASSGNKNNPETWVIGKIVSISSADSQFEQIEVETEESFEWFFKDNYFGIPLTEEWLIRLGFEKTKTDLKGEDSVWLKSTPDEYSWYISVRIGDYSEDNPNIGRLDILHPFNEEVSCIPRDLYKKEKWTEDDEKRCENHTETYRAWSQPVKYYLKYVHQLQNLFYSLCGEELTEK